MPTKPDVIVVGAGPSGLVAAIILATAGLPTVVVGSPPDDNRTTALLGGSVSALTMLDVWRRCESLAAPLRVMRLVDDTARLLRAPEVSFDSAEIGLEQFGHNIANRDLLAALADRAGEIPHLQWARAKAAAVMPRDDRVEITLESGTVLSAPLVVAADGRNSLCRDAAGIRARWHRYSQDALTVCIAHSRPHRFTSTEFHTDRGPFTVVPLPGNRSSLVWVMDPAAANDIRELGDPDLSRRIERQSHSILGKIAVEPGRGLFPLSSMHAEQFARDRIALVGEAAHVIPPIGAQGLNLGLRDAAVIGEIVVDSWRKGEDPGSPSALAVYDRRRRGDIDGRALAIDALNGSLLTDFLPVQAMRGLGMHAIDRIGPLRRALMRQGIAAVDSPRLMRGEAI